MNTKDFKVGAHYEHECCVGRVMVRHVHWLGKSDDKKLTSLFSMSIRSFRADFGTEASATASIDQWDVTPGELRALAEKMLAAADSLEAHEAQLAGRVEMKGGA